MATLSAKQKQELDIAASRRAAGKATSTDISNLTYAEKSLGYKYTPIAAPVATSPAPVAIAPKPIVAPVVPTPAPVVPSPVVPKPTPVAPAPAAPVAAAPTLTAKQKSELDIASARKASGTATATDLANLNYATKNLGYVYTPIAPAATPTVTPPAPTPTAPAATAPAAVAPAASTIPFKSGLTDAQKASITLLSKKPAAQWTDTDKANWNYATNNAAIPGATPSATAPAATVPFKTGLSETQKASITQLSQKPPDQWTQTDKDNWNYATNGAPIPGTVNAGTDAANGTKDFSNINNIADANAAINADQEADIAEGEAGDAPPIKQSYLDTVASAKAMEEALTPETNAPAAPEYAAKQAELRTTYGLDTLETELNDLNAQAREIEATKRARVEAERGKTVATNVIAGRISEAEQQENTRLDEINRQIAYKSDQLTTKYKVIDSIMGATKEDYETASAAYKTEFTNNVDMFNLLHGIQEEEKTEADKKISDARASLQIVYNQLTSGEVSAENLSPDQKALITKLELQAGLPVGFYETMKNSDPKANILGTYNWTDSANNEMVSVLTKDPTTGEIKTTNVSLGAAKATKATGGGSGGGGGGGESTNTTLTDQQINTYTSWMNQAKGEDGYTNTGTYRDIYNQIASMSGPKAAAEFLKRFPASAWLNPKDATAATFFGTKPSGLSVAEGSTPKWEDQKVVWQWLASPEAQSMDDEEKRTQIQAAGFNPEDFGL
jgi:hypothetical protein